MTIANLTPARLRELLHYDPITGVFTCRVRRGKAKVGTVAERIHNGYVEISIRGRRYRAHRLAWFHVYGVWPAANIDHINGDRSDNRWTNLREATQSQNQQNRRKAPSHARCGLLGVSRHAPTGLYRARITLQGKEKIIGYFATAELAHNAYVEAKRFLHPYSMI